MTVPAAVRLVVWIALALLTACVHAAESSPVPPLATCSETEIQAALAALPPYTPFAASGFVAIQRGHLTVGDATYAVHGLNYYPSQYPWRRFLTESDLDAVRQELDLLQSAGFNTLRIFLWNDALFQCPGSGAVPAAGAFQRLDGIIQSAAERGFRLIVTLNDLPDLTDYPLYDNPAYIQAQTRFIVQRYQNEAAILAWDLRNEGDMDYQSVNLLGSPPFSKQQVLDWLAATAAQVRNLDGHHFLTAGWNEGAEATAPYVDFVSFHHWADANQLRSRIEAMRAATDKPLLLEEVGYSTQQMSEDDQAQALQDIVQTADDEGLAGWLIWTAFDFPTSATCIPPACPSEDNAEHHFGLWRTDYTPKPAVAVLTSTFNRYPPQKFRGHALVPIEHLFHLPI